MIRTCCFVIVFLLLVNIHFAQSQAVLNFSLKISSEDHSLDSLRIIVNDDMGKIHLIDGDSLIVLPFELKKKFSLMLLKPRTKAKKIAIDTFVETAGSENFNYTLHVTLNKRLAGERTLEQRAEECKAEVTIFYNKELQSFDYRRGE